MHFPLHSPRSQATPRSSSGPVDGPMLRAVDLPDRFDRVAPPTDNGAGSEEAAVKDTGPKPVVPLLNVSAGGRVHEIQTFAHYVGTPAAITHPVTSFCIRYIG